MPILSWSARVFGSTATRTTGSGNSIDSRMIWFRLDREIVSPVVTFFIPPIATISPADAVLNVFTLVGMHQHQTSDTFFSILDRVLDVRT